MLKYFSPERAARAAAKHPLITLGVWVLILAAAFMGAGMTKTDNSVQANTSTESGRAQNLVERAVGKEAATETVVVQSGDLTVDQGAYRSYVYDLAGEIRALSGSVASVTTYYDAEDRSLISANRKTTLISVVLAGDPKDAAETVVPLIGVLKKSNVNGFTAMTVGNGSLNKEIGEVAQNDLAASEVIGMPAALIVLVIVFGAAVAAGVPLVLSIVAIFVAVGITGVVSQFVKMDDYVMNMIIMIGLAVGIDYTLFIVERFREERARGLAKVEAITRAGATASRAVLFSGITVIIALSGLLIMPSGSFTGMALGAIAAAAGAVLAAMTLLPAALSLLGDKVNALHLPGRGKVDTSEEKGGFWGFTTRSVMAHPVIAIIFSATILIAATAPLSGIHIGSPGISQMPQDISSVKAFNVLNSEFSAGRIAPVDIVVNGKVDSPAVRQSSEALAASLSSDAHFSGFTGFQSLSNDTALAKVYINGDSMGEEAQSALRQLRSQYVPQAFTGSDVEVLVGGGTAVTIDEVDQMKQYLPIVIGFVLTLSFVLLTVVFRSIVIPVKALIMNLLSVGAAYGMVVLVFQEGVGAGLLGFTQTDAIASFLPVFLFAILFGLSMDYHVFLLSRIQERFLATGDNRASVAHGLQSTAHIITGAAAIMVVVFGAFALGDLVHLQQMGFGLAVAVFIDATLIRSILVPASMELLGDRNWYLPSWLEWLPRVNIEGHAQPAAPRMTREYRLAPQAVATNELAPVRVSIND